MVSWILLAVILMMMVKYSYPLMVLVDALQLLYMHTYLFLGTLPYLWFNVNNVLGFAHFNFLPKLYTSTT